MTVIVNEIKIAKKQQVPVFEIEIEKKSFQTFCFI